MRRAPSRRGSELFASIQNPTRRGWRGPSCERTPPRASSDRSPYLFGIFSGLDRIYILTILTRWYHADDGDPTRRLALPRAARRDSHAADAVRARRARGR